MTHADEHDLARPFFNPNLFLVHQDLKDYMRQAGEVCYADAHKNHKGEGIVEFATQEDLKTALDKLDGTELNGRKITLTESKRRRKRSRSASRSPRRSRTKSRLGWLFSDQQIRIQT